VTDKKNPSTSEETINKTQVEEGDRIFSLMLMGANLQCQGWADQEYKDTAGHHSVDLILLLAS
jgi:hypothetical protein